MSVRHIVYWNSNSYISCTSTHEPILVKLKKNKNKKNKNKIKKNKKNKKIFKDTEP